MKLSSLPGVEASCGPCCKCCLRCRWLIGSSSSKISSGLFPARRESFTRIRLCRLRWIRWKVQKLIYKMIKLFSEQSIRSIQYLKSKLVRYSSGPKQIVPRMVRYSSHILNSKLIAIQVTKSSVTEWHLETNFLLWLLTKWS